MKPLKKVELSESSRGIVLGFWAHLPPLTLVALFFIAARLLLDANAHEVSYRIDETIARILRSLSAYVIALTLFGAASIIFVKARYETMMWVLRWLGRLDWREIILLRIPLAYLIIGPAGNLYINFKVNIPNFGPYSWDQFFAEADRLLFFGTDPWRITHAIFPSVEATTLIDSLYLFWFVQLNLVTVAVACLPLRHHLRLTYLLAFVVTAAFSGNLLAILMPAAGPVYMEAFTGNPMFAPLMERLYDQAGYAEIKALVAQERLWAGYVEPTGEPLGISAFPSIHVQYAATCTMLGFAANRALGRVFALFTAIMLVGSVHLAWHYAIDGIAGIALAIVIWRVSALISRWWLERTAPRPAMLADETPLRREVSDA